MPTRQEWINGVTDDGRTLPADKVQAWRDRYPSYQRTKHPPGSQRKSAATPVTNPPQTVNLDCKHRGQAVDRKANWPCNVDKTVYACELRGQCVKRAPSCVSVESLERSGIAVCSQCQQREGTE